MSTIESVWDTINPPNHKCHILQFFYNKSPDSWFEKKYAISLHEGVSSCVVQHPTLTHAAIFLHTCQPEIAVFHKGVLSPKTVFNSQILNLWPNTYFIFILHDPRVLSYDPTVPITDIFKYVELAKTNSKVILAMEDKDSSLFWSELFNVKIRYLPPVCHVPDNICSLKKTDSVHTRVLIHAPCRPQYDIPYILSRTYMTTGKYMHIYLSLGRYQAFSSRDYKSELIEFAQSIGCKCTLLDHMSRKDFLSFVKQNIDVCIDTSLPGNNSDVVYECRALDIPVYMYSRHISVPDISELFFDYDEDMNTRKIHRKKFWRECNSICEKV